MAAVLAFDTAAAHCAVALLVDGRIVTAAHEPMATGQAERLRPACEAVLAAAGAGWRDLDAVACGTGPGNFTGLRLSVAFARGLALGLKVPAIGVTAFEALAWGRDAALCVRDGRLGLVHLQAFGGCAWGPLTLPRGAPPPPVAPGTPVLGDLAEEVAALAGGRAAVPALPMAEAIARLAAGRLGVPQPRPAPLYLRPADASPPRDGAPPVLPG